MKRSCEGCRAFRLQFNGAACALQFKIANGASLLGRVVSGKPLEDCAKPRTVRAYLLAMVTQSTKIAP